MQNPELTNKINEFGELIKQLGYWTYVTNGEGETDDLAYAEEMFQTTLITIRQIRVGLMEDLEDYFRDCKSNDLPTDLGYFRIYKQLQESTFELT